MKIQLDLDNKKIKVEDEINLYEFFKAIKKLLPNDLWKEFTFDPTVINNWSNPIIIKDYTPFPVNPYPMNPSFPSYPSFPWITCTILDVPSGISIGKQASGVDFKLESGIFNIDCSIK